MELPARTRLVKVHESVVSYYKNSMGQNVPLHTLRDGKLAEDAANALHRLHQSVEAEGGTLLVTDCFRSPKTQARARKKYETWVAAGKPSPSSEAFKSYTMKAAFVAKPGRSNHNAGRAVDVAHLLAAPDSVPSSKKLDWLWDIAKPLGWTPVIKVANEGAREAWHFDFMGPWAVVKDRLGYEQAAMAGVLDLGLGADLYDRAWARWVQAQLHRAGSVDIGDIDGFLGRKTKEGAEALGIGNLFNPRYVRHGSFTPEERITLENALMGLADVELGEVA